MKNYFLVFSLVLVCQMAFSQSVVSYVLPNAGGFLQAGGTKVDFTFGEIVTELKEVGDIKLQQGFQQYVLRYIGVAVGDVELQNVEVYPNPTADYLFINNPNNKVIQLTLTSVDGKSIYFNQQIKSSEPVQLNFLAQGLYLLKLSSNNESKLFKIEKN
ncbi:MAG TPA: T9SS type A sorting domain-containing protein [Saprospiraceae bacterium]|nr:T9SS type A sorting domain-containing protein [Saprospiraceae bacterium]